MGGDANSSTVFSITGNTGQVSRGTATLSTVLGPSVTNAGVLFSGSISSFNANATNIGAVLRWTDGNNWYKASHSMYGQKPGSSVGGTVMVHVLYIVFQV